MHTHTQEKQETTTVFILEIQTWNREEWSDLPRVVWKT